MEKSTCYFGKYRGKVESNEDPMSLGRIQVSCPAVLGDERMSWAMPCTPYAGPGVGFFAIPPEGANVWVEFEGGDPNYPIWGGCFWGKDEVPADPAVADIKMFKTEHISITISDEEEEGGVTIEINDPAVSVPIKIVCDSDGVLITTEEASMTMTPETIVLTLGDPATIKMTMDGIELSSDPAIIKLTADVIEAEHDPSVIKITSDSIELESSAEGKFSSSGVELKNGGKSIEVGSSSVSINSGTMEVK